MGTGHDGVTRKEWERGCPSIWQARVAVLGGQEGVPSIPTTEI